MQLSKKQTASGAMIALIVFLLLGPLLKIFVADSFRARREATLTKLTGGFTMIDDLETPGFIVLPEATKSEFCTAHNIKPSSSRGILVLRGATFQEFRPREFHGVKGDLYAVRDQSTRFYVYSFNSRFRFPEGIQLEPIACGGTSDSGTDRR